MSRVSSLLTFAAAAALTRVAPASAASCPNSPPENATCASHKYYKISDEINGLATSCAAVNQPLDPVLGLDQHGCQSSCDALEGCDTVNFRWRDPNFGGQSTCYRKKCGDFATAACTLFSKHKERDVYTKACGADELWEGNVFGDFDGLFSGVECPEPGGNLTAEAKDVVEQCRSGAYVETEQETCSVRYYKLGDEFNGLSSSCPLSTPPDGTSASDPLVGLDQSACQESCDALLTPSGESACDTIEFRWRDPDFRGDTTCYRRLCGTFEDASCSLEYAGRGRDVYTRACGATVERWTDQTIADANTGLFAVVGCPDKAATAGGTDSPPSTPPAAINITCDPTEKAQSELDEQVCVDRYYKIADEANGLATSCAAVDQPSDPVIGLDQSGCQAACDAMEGCDTINFRWVDPNFEGRSTCYRKNCGDFKTAACTLFAKHKSRDVYTKACGASSLYANHVVIQDGNGLFAGIMCPNEEAPEVIQALESCGEGNTAPANGGEPQSCTTRYYKVSDEANGVATSCAAVDQPSDPVIGLDQAGCQSACDALEGCDTVNFRWRDPNFDGQSTCYRKNCGSFVEAAGTLFSKHKERDVFTKACGSEELWADHVLVDGDGLFAGVKVPGKEDPQEGGGSTERTCVSFLSTNRTNGQCDVCNEWSGGSSSSDIGSGAASVRTCLTWEKSSSTGISSCKEYAPSALQIRQRAEYNAYLQSRWSEVGVCGGNYVSGTTCKVSRLQMGGGGASGGNGGSVTSATDGDGEEDTCEVRDQPCHGGTELGGVAGVLSAGWQMTFGTTEDNHVCTMCGRGTYGSCEDACAYRRNFFWSGYNLGSIDVSMNAFEVRALYDAFVAAQPDETYEVPQTLELKDDVLAGLPQDHPLGASKLPSQSVYSIISVDEVMVTVRDQLDLIAVGLMNAMNQAKQAASESDSDSDSSSANEHKARTILSTSGVKVYETCQCFKCPRGQFQDGLGETSCKSCQDILPGSDTSDTGADGPQLCRCLTEANDNFLSDDGTQCVKCGDVRRGEAAGPPGTCRLEVETEFEDRYMVSANSAGFESVPADWVTSRPCDAVRNGTAAAPSGVCRCDRDTYETNARAAGVTDNPVHNVPSDWITCKPCPSGSSTFNDATNEHDYGSSASNCYCQVGTYGQPGSSCSACPSLKTSDWNSQSESDCKLTDSALLMAIVVPTGVVVFAVIVALLSMNYSRKIKKLEAERRRQMQEKVNEATEIVNHLAHPMVFLSARDFLGGGRMVKHEEARANQTLLTVDTMQELRGFKKTNTLIFFSHQWLAWAEPDPQSVQYNAMVSAMHELVETKELDIEKTYVWLDYTSIPQTHRGLQRLSINSLTNYAGACDYLIIVAPGRTIHADTGTMCDKKSYQDRAWCRAEQLAHGCRKGVEHMYLTADGGGLEPVTWDWVKPSFKIFSGDLTCCARGHDGMEQCDKEYLVTPVLGLYCELRALEKISCLPPEKKEILDFFRKNESEVFPQRFDFSLGLGRGSEERELFGEILELLDELDLKEDELDDDQSSKGSTTHNSSKRRLLAKQRQSIVKAHGLGSAKRKRNSDRLGVEINVDDIMEDWLDEDEKGESRRRSSLGVGSVDSEKEIQRLNDDKRGLVKVVSAGGTSSDSSEEPQCAPTKTSSSSSIPNAKALQDGMV